MNKRKTREKSSEELLHYMWEHREDLFAFNDDILLKIVEQFAYLAYFTLIFPCSEERENAKHTPDFNLGIFHGFRFKLSKNLARYFHGTFSSL